MNAFQLVAVLLSVLFGLRLVRFLVQRSTPFRGLVYDVLLSGLVAAGVAAYSIASSTAQFEAQAAADAAALAGATALMNTIGDTVIAARQARDVAQRNSVNGRPAEVRPEDISFEMPEFIIRLRVRGRALPFSLPLLSPEVSAKAAAQARAAYPPGHPNYTGLPAVTLQLIE